MIKTFANELIAEKFNELLNVNYLTPKNSFIILLSIIVIYFIPIFIKFIHFSNVINRIPGPKRKNLFIGNLNIFYQAANSNAWFEGIKLN